MQQTPFAPVEPDAANSCGIAVMAKASAPGHAKTRLVPPLTPAQAADCNTAFLQDVAANILAAAVETPIRGYMAYAPAGPNARGFFARTLPPAIAHFECVHADLGACLISAIEVLFAHGHRSAVVLNSDSPTLPTSLLVETARLLMPPGDRAVLGPSIDGGYYLLGLKAAHRRLFEDIAWSTERVAKQTQERAAEVGLPVHVLPAWYDVDDVESLATLQAELFDGRVIASGLVRHAAPHSDRLLRAFAACGTLAGGGRTTRAAE
jgi:uncharacterized protein